MSAFDVESFLRETLDAVWNGKLVGLLYERAAAGVAVHGPSGQELLGREAWIAAIMTWLAAFPDTRLEIEEIIWAGDEARGWLASARHKRTGTNRGASIYGAASGRPISSRGLSHFLVQGGLIRDVWQEQDELALALNLGLDLPGVLEQLAVWRWPASAEPFGLGEIKRGQGQLAPQTSPEASPFDVEDFVRRGLHDIWNRRLVGRIDELYAPELAYQAGDRPAAGRDALTAAVLARLAAFPDLSLHIDQLFCQHDEEGNCRVALAWTLIGSHTGPGVYGPATGRRIRLHGLCQQHVEDGRIVREWSQCGELSLAWQLAPAPT